MEAPAFEDLRAHLRAHGQEHLLEGLDALSSERRASYLASLAELDLPDFDRIRASLGEAAGDAETEPRPAAEVVLGTKPADDEQARRTGRDMIARGHIAAFTVAGGQGSRLGHEGPKGTFRVTPLANKALFQVFAEKLRALGAVAGSAIPWYVMTSPTNDAETRAVFEKNRNWGLATEDVVFLQQGSMPAFDAEGRILRAGPGRLFTNPDGHGGSLRALDASGALADMRNRGVEEIFYFQVDNPLVKVCDPTFLGYHRESGSDFSCLAVPKRDAHEKVGVLVQRGDRTAVIEYSDLGEELSEARDEAGQLAFRAGNIAVHVLRRAFVEELVRARFDLPWHAASKDIKAWGPEQGEETLRGTKLETFVFDALPLAERTFVLSVPREDHFSPVKNREGEDSPASCRRDQVEQAARWLRGAGVEVPIDASGRSVHTLEIGPLFAHHEERLIERRGELPSRVEGDLLLDQESGVAGEA